MPDNITLLQLPPYSPELNPIENLWHYLRCHHWSNRLYRDYDALFDAASEAWRTVCLSDDLIKTVCSAPYIVQRVDCGLRRNGITQELRHPEKK